MKPPAIKAAVVTFRLTKTDKRRLIRAARKAGMRPGPFVQARVLAAVGEVEAAAG